MRIVLEISPEEALGESAPTAYLLASAFQGAFDVAMRKERAYGGAWKAQGWMGNLARMFSKTARLKNMLWQPLTLDDNEEAVEDTVHDLINLCAFFLANRATHNRWGSS